MTMSMMTRALAITATLAGLTQVASAEESAEEKKGERALQQVYFDFNSATTNEDLLMVANHLECTPNDTIILDAFTDPVGSDDYNADLAMRRAKAVRDQLVELGIDQDRIMIGVFGERGERRDSHARDRRVEIRTSDEPVATLREKRQGTAVAVVAPGEKLEEVAIP
jgi:outer membrane protein OmpA-like peptidoglycan-associated protein